MSAAGTAKSSYRPYGKILLPEASPALLAYHVLQAGTVAKHTIQYPLLLGDSCSLHFLYHDIFSIRVEQVVFNIVPIWFKNDVLTHTSCSKLRDAPIVFSDLWFLYHSNPTVPCKERSPLGIIIWPGQREKSST